MKRDDAIGFSELHTQLRITNRLLAAQMRASMNQQELVRLLASTGATAGEIADILGTTTATVKTAVQRLRRRNQANSEPASDVSSEAENG